MDFAQHVLNYYKGAWLEAVLLTAFGLAAAVAASVMWQYPDQNALLKGLFYPLALLATFTLVAGGDMLQGVALGLIGIGAMGFLIDAFAHHRAKIYTAVLLAQDAELRRAQTPAPMPAPAPAPAPAPTPATSPASPPTHTKPR